MSEGEHKRESDREGENGPCPVSPQQWLSKSDLPSDADKQQKDGEGRTSELVHAVSFCSTSGCSFRTNPSALL